MLSEILRVSEILARDGKNFQVLMNVSCGDKLIGCAAFINGLKAFGMDEKGLPILMPILKLSYNEVISESKIKILKAIDDAAGGFVESLEQLEAISGYGKPTQFPCSIFYDRDSQWFTSVYYMDY